MKFRNFFCTPLAVVGLGAALLLANTAHAQQDMDPTVFDIKPGIPQETPAATQIVQTDAAATQNLNSNSPLAAQQPNEAAAVQDATTWPELDARDVVLLSLCVGISLLLAVGATRLDRRRRIIAESVQSA